MGDQGLGPGRVRGTHAAPAGSDVVEVDSRQRIRRVPRADVVALAQAVLRRLGRTGEIGIHLVGPAEMARVNWDFLRHEGSTDVITFDHGSTARHLHGECFICVADAVVQAREWGTCWEEELGRYVIHALLHLAGHDDLEPVARRRMKRREEALTRALVIGPRWLQARAPAAGS